MPLGEDIPMLIPMSIVITLFLVFIIALIFNFSEQTEIVRNSQISINIGDYLVNTHQPLSLGMGRLNGTYLESQTFPRNRCPDRCKESKLSFLMNSSYNNIAVKIETEDRCWCWNSVSGKQVVINSFPVLIVHEGKTIPAKVMVSVSK